MCSSTAFGPGTELGIYRANSPSDSIAALFGLLGRQELVAMGEELGFEMQAGGPVPAASELHVRHGRLSAIARCRIMC